MQHGPFAVPFMLYFKPHQAQPYLDKTSSSTFRSWPTSTKLEITGNHWPNNKCKNKQRIDYDYKVGDKVLIAKYGILRISESKFGKEPWTITTVHMNGTIRVQCGTKSRRVTPFTDELILE